MPGQAGPCSARRGNATRLQHPCGHSMGARWVSWAPSSTNHPQPHAHGGNCQASLQQCLPWDAWTAQGQLWWRVCYSEKAKFEARESDRAAGMAMLFSASFCIQPSPCTSVSAVTRGVVSLRNHAGTKNIKNQVCFGCLPKPPPQKMLGNEWTLRNVAVEGPLKISSFCPCF